MSERKVYRRMAKETIGEMMFRLGQKGLNPRRYVTVKKTGKEDRIVKTEKPVRLSVFANRVRDQIAEQLNREVWSLPEIVEDTNIIKEPVIDPEITKRQIERFSEPGPVLVDAPMDPAVRDALERQVSPEVVIIKTEETK